MSTTSPSLTKHVKPFIPWVGGKRRLLKFIIENTPETFLTYHEPFLGGGAVALRIMEEHPDSIYRLSDFNPHLINAWEQVRSNVDELVEHLSEHTLRHSKPYFKSVRDWDKKPGLLEAHSEVEQAARFIYLCIGAFSGQYSENDSGQCSSSFGRAEVAFNEDNLRRVSDLLQNHHVIFQYQSFEQGKPAVQAGDFVYLDPPYATDSDDGSDTYSTYLGSQSVDAAFQKTVKRYLSTLTNRGAMVLASNASTNTTRDLYDGWNEITHKLVWSAGGGNGAHEATEVLWGNINLARALNHQ